MAHAYYTMTATDVLLDDLDRFESDIASEGNKPKSHQGSPDDRRKKHCAAVTFTWFFDSAAPTSSWDAYHCVVRSYAVAAQRRYTCRFSTHVNGTLYNHLLSPAIGTEGKRWQPPKGKLWP